MGNKVSLEDTAGDQIEAQAGVSFDLPSTVLRMVMEEYFEIYVGWAGKRFGRLLSFTKLISLVGTLALVQKKWFATVKKMSLPCFSLTLQEYRLFCRCLEGGLRVHKVFPSDVFLDHGKLAKQIFDVSAEETMSVSPRSHMYSLCRGYMIVETAKEEFQSFLGLVDRYIERHNEPGIVRSLTVFKDFEYDIETLVSKYAPRTVHVSGRGEPLVSRCLSAGTVTCLQLSLVSWAQPGEFKTILECAESIRELILTVDMTETCIIPALVDHRSLTSVTMLVEQSKVTFGEIINYLNSNKVLRKLKIHADFPDQFHATSLGNVQNITLEEIDIRKNYYDLLARWVGDSAITELNLTERGNIPQDLISQILSVHVNINSLVYNPSSQLEITPATLKIQKLTTFYLMAREIPAFFDFIRVQQQYLRTLQIGFIDHKPLSVLAAFFKTQSNHSLMHLEVHTTSGEAYLSSTIFTFIKEILSLTKTSLITFELSTDGAPDKTNLPKLQQLVRRSPIDYVYLDLGTVNIS